MTAAARTVEEPRQAPPRRLLIILGALTAFGPLSLDMYLPGLPALTRDLHASASTGQLTLTACMLGIAFGQLITGPVSDARGRRTPLLIGLAGYIAASLACAAAPSVGTLIALRLIQGLFGGTGVVIARAIVRDLFDGAMAARVYAFLMMIMGAAPVFAPLIGGQALAITSWRGIFIVLAAVGVPILIATWALVPETLPARERHGGGLRATVHTFGRLLVDRTYIPFAAAFSLASGALFGYIAGSSFVIEDVYRASPQVFSVVFAVNSAGLIALSQLGGSLVERAGPERLLRRGLAGVAVAATGALVCTALHAPLLPLLVALFVMVSCLGIVFPNGTAAALAGQRGALGSASALLGLGQFGFGAAVAPLVGLAGSYDALPMGLVVAFCGVSAFGVDLLFARPGSGLAEKPET